MIEVVATVAIASVIMVALISFFSVVSRVFVASAIESEDRLIVSNVKGYLKNQLGYAADVKNTVTTGYDSLSFSGGRLYRNGALVFDEAFYGNTNISGSMTGFGSALTFRLIVENSGQSRTEDYVITTMNKSDSTIAVPITTFWYK